MNPKLIKSTTFGAAHNALETFSQMKLVAIKNACNAKIKPTLEAFDQIVSVAHKKAFLTKMLPQFCLLDLVQAKNVQELVTMPYMRNFCSGPSVREILECPSRYNFPNLPEPEVISLLIPQTASIDELLQLNLSQTQQEVRFDWAAIQDNLPSMDCLVAIYAYAIANADTCVLPNFEGVQTWAAPRVKMVIDKENPKASKQNFIDWTASIYKKFNLGQEEATAETNR